MDLVAVSRDALQARSALSYPVALVAGMLSSLGPCAVTRYAALANVSTRAQRPVRSVFAFVGGVVVVYALLGIVASLIDVVVSLTAYLCAGAALLYFGYGVRTALLSTALGLCGHEHPELGRGMNESGSAREAANLASAFVLGVSASLIISPCCAPFLGLTIAVAAMAHDPLWGGAVLSVFAIGHAMPLLAYGIGGAYCFRIGNATSAYRHVLSVVFAGLMFAVAVAYAVQI